MAVVEGKPAPSFTLEDPDGKKVSLKDFKGTKVILSNPDRTMMENYGAYGEKVPTVKR